MMPSGEIILEEHKVLPLSDLTLFIHTDTKSLIQFYSCSWKKDKNLTEADIKIIKCIKVLYILWIHLNLKKWSYIFPL